jgi:hypothetical protein
MSGSQISTFAQPYAHAAHGCRRSPGFEPLLRFALPKRPHDMKLTLDFRYHPDS